MITGTEKVRLWREKTKKLCPSCNKTMILKESNQCHPCSSYRVLPDKPLSDLIYTKHHRSSAFALVRQRARSVSEQKPCANCGYDKHTEVCHIKSIASFDLSTPVSVINDTNNLVRLCPNCHWEFDMGLVRLSEDNAFACVLDYEK